MLRFEFNKLVRSKIIEQQLAAGSKPAYHLLDKKEHLDELIKKLAEEADELLAAQPEDAAAEIADLQQALDDIIALLAVDPKKISREQKRKASTLGTFQKGVFIEYVDADENNPWVAYYKQRYRQIDD